LLGFTNVFSEIDFEIPLVLSEFWKVRFTFIWVWKLFTNSGVAWLFSTSFEWFKIFNEDSECSNDCDFWGILNPPPNPC
jgi:hypothetical protein